MPTNNSAKPLANQPRRGYRRIFLMRIAAIAFGFLLLLLLEGILWTTGAGKIADVDPFVGFSGAMPLFELNEEGTRFQTSPLRYEFFRPDAFRATKAEDEFRVFCFGGSTVQGRPYAIETSFTTWLELTLKAADPDRDWRIVNCGGVSYASYRLIPILAETLHYQPDLFVIYTGHNEFLEDRSYEQIKHRPQWLKAVHERAIDWRIYRVASQLFQRSPEENSKADLPGEVDALLDYQGGLAKYHRNDQWHRGVEEHYELNLRRMIRLAKDAGVPVILANPISDIRDTPPFKVESDGSLSDEQLQEFETAWSEAKEADWDDPDTKLAAVEKAIALDPRNADAHFLLGKVLEASGEYDRARQAYYRAKDEDICPLRMTEVMHASVKTVAKQTGTPLIDVRRLFEEKSINQLPGEKELIDHVHPHIDGHQWIAELLFNQMVTMGFASKQDGWEKRRDQLFQDNYTTLPDSYFPFALSRLEGLINWARGRVDRIHPDDQGTEPATDE